MEEENFWITRTTSSLELATFFIVSYLINLSLSRLIKVGNLTNRSQDSVVDIMIISQAGGVKKYLRLPAWSREFYSSKTYTQALGPRQLPMKLLLVLLSHGKATGLSPPSFLTVTLRGAKPPLSHMTLSNPLPLLHRFENKHLTFMLLSVNTVYFICKIQIGFLKKLYFNVSLIAR